MRSYCSPLRYPGGKGAIADLLADIILYNNLEGGDYYEPYAGGAGVALHLLFNGIVKKIHINDADFSIYAFWHTVVNNSEIFLSKLKNISVDIEQWHIQKNILNNVKDHSIDEVGFAVFFINRCNRSGIINSAGPIGGYSQNGRWKIDARFNKNELSNRIEKIVKYKEGIMLSNDDAIDFLKENLPKNSLRKKSFIYLDPPYYIKGKKLYLNFYTDPDHKELSQYIKQYKSVKWVMTYDNAEEIHQLYDIQYELALNYSLQQKIKGKEVFICPDYLKLPTHLAVNGRLKKIYQ